MKVIDQAMGAGWAAYNADTCDAIKGVPDDSVGFSVYSPPFSNLYVYSDSERDMGNAADDDEFLAHYGFLVREKLRVTMPGRLSAVHCSDLPLTKWKDGVIGIKDFSGAIIRAHEAAGWTLHSRVTVWKCPVVEMTRTKARGLLYKQLKKDSSKSRQGMADYVLVFMKPGENPAPIAHDSREFPVEQWQKWASPVWMDVQQTRVLNVRGAREQKDEKHLCPLQLDLIERALILWSNKDDTVLSPFMGIGSEGVGAIKLRRKFIGFELKPAYYRQAVANLQSAEAEYGAGTLLHRMAVA